MLVISRKVGGRIYIGDDITIMIADIDHGKVRVGIEAPRGLPIYRDDLCPPGAREPADVTRRKAEIVANSLPRSGGDHQPAVPPTPAG